MSYKIVELERPSYDEVRKAIGGGLVQYVPDFYRYKGRECQVFVDEEGLFKFTENHEATRAWQEYLEMTAPGQWDPDMAHLVGDVVIAYGGMK